MYCNVLFLLTIILLFFKLLLINLETTIVNIGDKVHNGNRVINLDLYHKRLFEKECIRFCNNVTFTRLLTCFKISRQQQIICKTIIFTLPFSIQAFQKVDLFQCYLFVFHTINQTVTSPYKHQIEKVVISSLELQSPSTIL